jgi:hypothetical protein
MERIYLFGLTQEMLCKSRVLAQISIIALALPHSWFAQWGRADNREAAVR